MIGAPENSRQVGFALKHLPQRSLGDERIERPLPQFNHDTVPWWRIIGSQGKISLIAERKQRQIERLQEENVDVEEQSGKIKLSEFGWFPEDLYL